MSDAGQGISATGLLVVLWVLTGVATILFIGRLVIRGVLLKKFHLDDAFGALAWFLLLVSMICATIQTPLTYHFSSILIGETPAPSEEEMADMTITLRRWNVAVETLFWTSLYSVKLSFMFLYRYVLRSGGRNKHIAVWSAALVYIILCYGICLIGVYGQCGDVRNLFTYQQCMTPYVASLIPKLIWISFFFNVTSDLVVVILPMPVIWSLQMRLHQKLAVSGLCSLAIVTIAFETARSVKLYELSNSFTNLYSYLELIISVLVGMLPSYRFLVSPTDKDREYRRLFWSRITLRSYNSGSSSYSMH
ncbi:uncharacterized protein GGS25DRAFT_15350 [Hypoxylon fragiforme]|uniref:uncharacterized protein n=1 Tax=Hypoxylon fragiforme TaxID=63214 RepID=UPI0020C72977|nr:uncharacterized protein GGS25DRAFT_15350 [Hypoxylon fragiforme]KAI2613765.1 hypothetical protein GGS25DRAFT_15350 [Hypoxylon fragiforme]